MRAAIYARYSSDNQREASIEDQITQCKKKIDSEDWELVDSYYDRAISGATLLRPGYQKLLEDIRSNRFDVIVSEALDRLSRDQEDVAALYKQLSFAGVTLITLSEGEISELHVGLKGTMNALFLKDLAIKTHRGLSGRAQSGKSAGGKSYGYDIVRKLDDTGEPVRGGRRINRNEAQIIKRVFVDYISGKSPRAIAIALNQEKILGPTGKGWTASTIIGNRKRGTGILNNQLYVGKQVWNRLHYRKDPKTRKRVSQLNPPETWIISDVPDLRIIDDELWNTAQTLQDSRSRETRPDRQRSPDWHHRRPKHLFSGLIKCAACGGGMTLISRVYYGCSANRNKGTCNNHLTMRLDRLEEAVLQGLQEHLLTKDLTDVFAREYTLEINRQKDEASAKHNEASQKLITIDKQITNIVEAIATGRSGSALLDRLEALEKEKKLLNEMISDPVVDSIRIHPNLTELYIKKVSSLRDNLNSVNFKNEASQILRSLVDEIRLHPIEKKLQIELVGDLASLIGFGTQYDADIKKPGSDNDPGCTKWLVAGARNRRYLHLDFAPIGQLIS
ncbi:MAG TPA: recombinase family protein [Rhodospirillales bacterium]|nr:recombinase family protein [Rhodospirillales bacterium]